MQLQCSSRKNVCYACFLSCLCMNTIINSEDFTVAPWNSTTITAPTGDVRLAPNNTMTADRIELPGGPAWHAIYQTSNTTESGKKYTFSVYLEADEHEWFQILTFSAGFAGSGFANFNAATGAIGASFGGTPAIEAVGNYYRCSVDFTADKNTSAAAFAVGFTDNTASNRAESTTGTVGD